MLRNRIRVQRELADQGLSLTVLTGHVASTVGKAHKVQTYLQKGYKTIEAFEDGYQTYRASGGASIPQLENILDEMKFMGNMANEKLNTLRLKKLNRIMGHVHTAADLVAGIRNVERDDYGSYLVVAGKVVDAAAEFIPVRGVSNMMEYYGHAIGAIGGALGKLQRDSALGNLQTIQHCSCAFTAIGGWLGPCWAVDVIEGANSESAGEIHARNRGYAFLKLAQELCCKCGHKRAGCLGCIKEAKIPER